MAKKSTPKKRINFDSPEDVMNAIKQKYGEESITIAGDRPIVQVPAISTGSLTLDQALGVWGVPKGRIVEVYGVESGGKTTLTLSIVKQCQKAGGTAAFVDAEHALDPYWARNIGVDVDSLMISQPDSAEEGLGIVELLAGSGKVDLVVIDSVAALTPQAEIDGELGDSHIGLMARLMSQALRRLKGVAKKSGCTVIFINQIRMKIGVMFGSPETTPGGKALKFYSSVRLDVRRKSAIKESEDNVGNIIKVKVVKNKVAPPFRQAECNLYFGKNDHCYGIDYPGSVLELAVSCGIVEKSGSWYSFDGYRIGNGLGAACKVLGDDEELLNRIEAKVKESVGVIPIESKSPENNDEVEDVDDLGFEDDEDIEDA